MKTSKLTLIFAAAAIVAVPSVGKSADYDVEVRAGIGVSDNIGRTVTGELDETIAMAGFNFDVTHISRKLDLSLRSNVDYLDYLDDTFDSEWVGGLNGSAVFSLVEERFDWVFTDTFGQQLLDPLAPARPGNRENVNIFSTGPTFNLLAGSRNSIVLDARYSNVNYEERPFDNDRVSGALSFGRETTRDSTVSLNFTAEQSEFDNDGLTPDYDRYDGFVRYEKVGARNTVTVDLGYNEVEYDDEKGDGFLWSITWTRAVSANGSFSLMGGTRYSDQGNIFQLYQEITNDLGETIDGAVTPAPFQSNYLTLAYGIDHARYTVDLSASWSEEDYEGGFGLNRELIYAHARFHREISRKFFAGINIGFSSREFEAISSNYDDLTLGLNLGYRISDGFSVTLDYQNFQRDGDISGADVTENRAFLRLSYVPVWSR